MKIPDRLSGLLKTHGQDRVSTPTFCNNSRIVSDGGNCVEITVSIDEQSEIITICFASVGTGYIWEGKEDSGKIKQIDFDNRQIIFSAPSNICSCKNVGTVSVNSDKLTQLSKLEEKELKSFSEWVQREREQKLEFKVVKTSNDYDAFTPVKQILREDERRKLEMLKESYRTDIEGRIIIDGSIDQNKRYSFSEVEKCLSHDDKTVFEDFNHVIDDLWTEEEENGEAWCAIVTVTITNNIEAVYKVENRIGEGWQCYLKSSDIPEEYDRKARTYLRIEGPVDPSFRLPNDQSGNLNW